MIDPASSWFEIVELLVVELTPTSSSKIKAMPHVKTKDAYFDKSSSMITWFSRYPCCQHIIYDNRNGWLHLFGLDLGRIFLVFFRLNLGYPTFFNRLDPSKY